MSLLQVQFHICYLNYGLLAARAEILGVAKDADNPCILTGYNGVYTYGGIDYKVSAPSSGSNMIKCGKEVLKALKVNESTCTYPKCTFSGVWNGGGGDGQNNMYVGSYFYDRAAQVGFINVSERVVEVRPQDFKVAAKHACETTFEDAKSTYPNVDPDDLPYLCMDLV
ncbi:putative apyrase [Helianthus debilis subsp. tardiflorus]